VIPGVRPLCVREFMKFLNTSHLTKTYTHKIVVKTARHLVVVQQPMDCLQNRLRPTHALPLDFTRDFHPNLVDLALQPLKILF